MGMGIGSTGFIGSLIRLAAHTAAMRNDNYGYVGGIRLAGLILWDCNQKQMTGLIVKYRVTRIKMDCVLRLLVIL